MADGTTPEKARPRRNARERDTLVEQWRRSDESPEQFCAKNNISLGTFGRWRAECGRKNGASEGPSSAQMVKQPPTFVEVRASRAGGEGIEASSADFGEVVIVAEGGFRIELRGDAGRRAVDQIVAMLDGRR